MKKKALAILLSLAVSFGSCANLYAADFEVDKVEIIDTGVEMAIFLKKELAKKNKIEGYTSMKKAELVEALTK